MGLINKENALKLVLRINPYIFWVIISHIVMKFHFCSLNVQEIENNIIEELRQTEKSLIRWGDGESISLFGGNIYFQTADQQLQLYLYNILKNYTDNSSYLVGMPIFFLNSSNNQLKFIKKEKIWRMTKFVYLFFCNKNACYCNSFAFRPDKVNTLKGGVDDPESLWYSFDNLILLHNNKKIYTWVCKKYKDKKIFWVPVPPKDAFEQFDRILNSIYEIAKENYLNKKNSRVLLSVGLTAKALIYELKEDFICYDLGHYFDYI